MGNTLTLEECWKRLQTHLRWQERHSSWLAFVFSPSPDSIDELRRKTQEWYRSKQWVFESYECTSPEQLLGVLATLMEEPPDGQPLPECVWIEALGSDLPGQGPGPWTKAWNALMLRLNENRDRLRSHLQGGLVFAGPPMLKARMHELAPDFWSIRTFVLDVPESKETPQTRAMMKTPPSSSSSFYDALILTALREELDAIIARDEDGGESPWKAQKDSHGFLYYTRRLQNQQGQTLSLAAASVSDMGKAGAAARSTQLLMELNPPCIFMCGICAGDAQAGLHLGDIVVADRVYSYDSGKHIGGESGREEIFYQDITTYNLERAWKHQIEDFLREPQGWLACKPRLDSLKPPSKEAQQRWLMHRLYEHQEQGAIEPLVHPERKKQCPDWAKIIDKLEALGLIEIDDTLRLSPQAIKQVKRERLTHPDGWPSEPGVTVHIGAMATGEAVQQDKDLFSKLKRSMRKTLAVEMEAAAVGHVANFLDRRALIVKAVADFGNADKDDSYRTFGCRASAAFLLAFIMRWLEPVRVESESVEREDEDGEARGPEFREREGWRPGRRHGFPEDREDLFWKEVRDVTRLRNPGAPCVEKRIGHGFSGLLEVKAREGTVWTTCLVAGIDRPYSQELVQTFIEHIEAPYRRNTPMMRSTLVHGGDNAPQSEQDKCFHQKGILLVNLNTYQGLIDFGRFLDWQTRRLDRNPAYPSDLYIEQPAVLRSGVYGSGPMLTQNALLTLHETLNVRHPRFVLLLGEFGTGKTFLLHELSRKLSREQPGLLPVLVEMGQLQKSISLEKLLAQHFTAPDIGRIEVDSFLYMLGQGRIALLLDGFDELAFRSGPDLIQQYFRTVLGAMRGDSKVVLASRRSHFLSDNDYKNALALEAERLSGVHTLLLSQFDETRIRRFFIKFLQGNEAEADRRLGLYRNIEDLMGLAANPRMMSFIAELSPEELQEAAQRTKAVTSGDLYEKLIDRWFQFERDRTKQHGEPVLNKEQMHQAMVWVALHAWTRPDKCVSLSEMPVELQGILRTLIEPGRQEPDEREAAHEIRSRSLLVRDEEGRFGFLHQSILEWWVAKAASEEFWASSFEDVPLCNRADMSDLMAGFFVDLVKQPDALRIWVGSVLSPGGKGHLKTFLTSNALRVLKYLDRYHPVAMVLDLSGQDLRGRDFSGSQELKGADLRGADLRGATLVGADLSGADLSGAKLSDANLEGANLSGTELSEADFSFARAMRVDFSGAKSLEKAHWMAAKLVGAKGELAREEWQRRLQAWGAAPPTFSVARAIADTTTYLSSLWGGPRIAFSQDGRLLAWVRGNSIALYDAKQGLLLGVLPGHTNDVHAVAFTSDGTVLASASDDKTAKLWDARSGTCLLTLQGHQYGVNSVAFTSDGTVLASASDDKTAKLWDARSGACLLTLQGHQHAVTSVAFNPGGTTLASASDDNTAKLWDVRSGACLRTLDGHQHRVNSIAFNADGTTLASASYDNTAKLWDARSGTCLLTLQGHQDRVNSVAFNADGTTLASASDDNTAELWDARSGTCLRTLHGHQHAVNSIAFNADGNTLASASLDNTAKLWEARSGTCLLTLQGHQDGVNSVAFNADGTTLASASYDNTAKLWEVRSGTCLLTLQDHQERVNSVAFNAEGTMLASASLDDTVKLWDARSGTCILTLEGHQHAVNSVAFNPSGALLASASRDNTAKLWDTSSGKCLLTLVGHQSSVTSVAFHPSGNILASASYDKTAKLWDTSSGKCLLTLKGHQNTVYSVAFNPSGALLASASLDKTAKLWDTSSGQCILTLVGHQYSVTSVAFNPSGALLASASLDKTAKLWDTSSGQCILTLKGHTHSVNTVAFNPSGTRLITSSRDGTIRFWSTRTGECLAIIFPLPNGWVAYRPKDGRFRAHGDLEGRFFHSIGLCRFEPGELDPYLPTPLTLREDEPLIPEQEDE